MAGMRYAKLFAQDGFVVVGLALGCDTVGHEGCLSEKNGVTIAILAHSLDLPVYPKQNADVANNVLKQNGLFIQSTPLEQILLEPLSYKEISGKLHYQTE